MDFTSLFSIALGAILVNNFIFSQFLGICPFMGVSKKVDTALGMGMAVIFVMGVASAVCWPINKYLLVANGLDFMQTVTYILVIASLEMCIRDRVLLLGQILIVDHRVQGGDVFQQVDEHRPGPAHSRHGKGLPDDVGDLVGVPDQVGGLGAVSYTHLV